MRISIKGDEELIRLLNPFADPRELDRQSQKALLAAGRTLRTPLRHAAPLGATGNLRKSVRVKRGRRDRPSVIAGPTAPHRHLVIRGTKPHIIPGPVAFGGRVLRNIRHPGARPNDFVGRTARAHEDRVVERYEAELLKGKL